MQSLPTPQRTIHFWRWFDPRFRKPGSWAFILNRITALGLTLYLFLHLTVLSQLVVGQIAYDRFIALAHQPFLVAGELLVVLAALIHGLNGIRIVLTHFGWGLSHQKKLFWGVLILVAAAGFYFALRMFMA